MRWNDYGTVADFFRCIIIDFMFFCAHSVNETMIGTRDLPISVNSYSTRIGTSGNTVLLTKSSASNVRNVLDNTFVEISGISFPNWLNRIDPVSLKTRTTSNVSTQKNTVVWIDFYLWQSF